jgi:hypothetical protein
MTRCVDTENTHCWSKRSLFVAHKRPRIWMIIMIIIMLMSVNWIVLRAHI